MLEKTPFNTLLEKVDDSGFINISEIEKICTKDEKLFFELEEELSKFNVKIDYEIQELSIDDDADSIVKSSPSQIENCTVQPINAKNHINDPVKAYFKTIAKIPLLSVEEEFLLGKKIIDSKEAEQKLICSDDLEESEVNRLKNIVIEGRNASDRLVDANYRLVIYVAKKYLKRGLTLIDLISEGNMGLLKAVARFDYRLGNRFSTYATQWIRQTISRAIANQGRTIRLPVHMIEYVNKYFKYNAELTASLMREPTVQELSKAMNLPVKKVRMIKRLCLDSISLDLPVGSEKDNCLEDFIEDDNSLSPSELKEKESIQEILNYLLSLLSPREEKILRLRSGFGYSRVMTLEEIGNIYGVTRERIRQIEVEAYKKVKCHAKTNGFEEILKRYYG